MKNNLSYYRHEADSHEHWKFKTLRRKFGWAGEGRFWALNNIIARSCGCRLDISHVDKLASIAADLDLSVEEFNEFSRHLVDVAKLITEENGCLLTPITQENLEGVSGKRERQREWKKQKSTTKIEEPTSKPPKSTVDNEQSKKKESKIKKSKIYELGEVGPFGSKVLNDEWSLWLRYRREKKNPVTLIGAEQQISLLLRHTPEEAIDIIQKSITSGWSGLFEKKEGGNKPFANTGEKSPKYGFL